MALTVTETNEASSVQTCGSAAEWVDTKYSQIQGSADTYTRKETSMAVATGYEDDGSVYYRRIVATDSEYVQFWFGYPSNSLKSTCNQILEDFFV